QYILDFSVGIQFGCMRGPFASSESLGGALIVTFLFDVLLTSRAKGMQLYWAYIMTPITAGVIYTTNQRSAWLGFCFSLVLLAIAKSKMKWVARSLMVFIFLGFLFGVASKFSAEQGTLFYKRQESINYRIVNYLTALEMIKANPIFGIGYGNFVL